MTLDELKNSVSDMESRLAEQTLVVWKTFHRDARALHVALTDRLRKSARKAGLWRSKEMLSTLQNASYGFDETRSRSRGGSDGIFLLDRAHRPANPMMRKIFDRFLDKPGSEADAIAAALGVDRGALLPVRLVSHHMRLLGVLVRRDQEDWLVLVDCDRTK